MKKIFLLLSIILLSLGTVSAWTAGLNNGLVHYYGFNDNSTSTLTGDFLGTLNGSVQGNAVYNSTAKLGNYSIKFDGNGDYVNLTQSSNFQTGNGTISLWFRSDTVSTDRFVISDRGASGDYIFVADPAGGAMSWRINSGGTFQVYPTESYIANVWQHLVITWGSSGMKMYVNGTLNGTDAYTGNWASTFDLLLGCAPAFCGAGNSFAGHIDEVGYWNRQLSGAEVSQVYNAGIGDSPETFTPPQPSPFAYWRFDEGSGINTTDSVSGYVLGGNNITSSNWVSGINNSAFNTSEIDNNVSKSFFQMLNSSFNAKLDYPLTISFWVKPHRNDTKFAIMANAQSTTHGFEFFMDGVGGDPIYSTGKLFNYVSDGSSWSKMRTPDVLNAEEWYYVATTYNSSGSDLYLNGVYVNHTSRTLNSSDWIFRVGASSDTPSPATGYYASMIIDELKFFNESLSAEQVLTDYQTNYTSVFTPPVIPSVTLYSPANNLNTTNGTVNFNCSISLSSARNLSVDLIINGIVNKSVSAGVVSSYGFFDTVTLPVGVYTWTCNATNVNESVVGTAPNRNLIIDIFPLTYYIVSDYDYLVISDAGMVAQDTSTSLATTVNWFGIIIVIVMMVALILLTVLIINVVRGTGGFVSAGGTA